MSNQEPDPIRAPAVVADVSRTRWRMLSDSVRGASHERENRPNQDFQNALPGAKGMVLAIADGHGSAKSFRSQLGSKMAVEAALEVAEQFLEDTVNSTDAINRDLLEQQIPKRMERDWRRRVDEHFRDNPFTAEELETLETAAGLAACQALLDPKSNTSHYIAYGSTLLVAIIADEFIGYLQLGDGDILAVFDTASADVSRPIQRDENLIANETTSLCMNDAWKFFRCRFQKIRQVPPALVLLSTDGYANSFTSSQGFLKVGVDLVRILRQEGIAAAQEALSASLHEAAGVGSGDDVTALVAFREELIDGRKPSVIEVTTLNGPHAAQNSVSADFSNHLLEPGAK